MSHASLTLVEDREIKVRSLTYYDETQELIGKIFYPPTPKDTYSAIIVYPAFEGLSDFALDYAHDLCLQGYIVLAADIYGNAQSASTIPDCFELIGPFLQDRALVRRRAQSAFQALQLEPLVNKDNIGAIGFCFGGQCMLELARSGASLKAGVSAHGILTASRLQTYPIKSHLLILHGFADPQVPINDILSFTDEVTVANCPDWQIIMMSHAQHSFTDPKTGTFDPDLERSMGRVYNHQAAMRVKKYAMDFFKEQLV
ncbi:dienelactone hydrolase family protein [bacterium]|jgi:dienelactone hydrolase|nr:dienelactone hydrolase family protein [bacterium]NBW56969.1 dienelactone hydrolase family protein [bacterium]NBX71492.1 dienelactone hydrolase family protein [bacterium]